MKKESGYKKEELKHIHAFTYRMTEAEQNELRAVSKQSGIPASEIVRTATRQYIKKLKRSLRAK